MQIKLRLTKAAEESIRDELNEKNIEISEDASLILTEEDYVGDSLACRDEDDKGIFPEVEEYAVTTGSVDIEIGE